MRIAWTAAALRDLAAVRAFIAVDNLNAADRQVRRVLQAIDSLLSFPHMGRPGRRAGTRELVIAGTPYLVAYRFREDVIEILRVLHGRQRWPDRL